MSYSGGNTGWQTNANGVPSFNFGSMLSGAAQAFNPIGGTVGTETPEYDFPMGIERVPMDVQEMFLRGDAGPTRLNEFLQNADPKVIDRFRSAVNMGLIRPKNAAADQIIKGYGGLRAGDMAGPGGILGPMMDDMPSGLSPEYWQQANTLIGTMIDAQMKAAEQSGYFNGMPTVERERIMGELAQGWKQQFTNEFLANEQKRASQAQEGMTQQEINNQNLQAMAGIMGGTVNPQTGQFQQTEQGRQFDTTATGWMNGQRTLAGELQDWNMQKDVANAAANPRDYIYAQMLGNARGGLAGQPPTNQLQMPGRDGMGMPGGAAQNAWNPANYNAATGQLGAGNAGMNPLASTQPPGTSGAGTLAQMGPPGATDGALGAQAEGLPATAGAQEWARMFQQAQASQDQARQTMTGAQQGPGAGAASALSPGPGSAGMAQPYGGYQGQDGKALTQDTLGGIDAQRNELLTKPMPNLGQGTFSNPFQPNPDGTQNTRFIPEGGMQGGMQLQPFQVPQLGQGQMGQGMPATARAQEWVRNFQQGQMGQGMPQQRPGMALGQGQMGQGMPQQRPAVPGQPQFTTSAFTQQLLKNRMVPGSGAIQGQGQYMTQQQMQKQINPNKIRAQDFLRGRDSEQKGFLGAASAAGYSDEDTLGAIKNNAPKFQAPGAGRMI